MIPIFEYKSNNKYSCLKLKITPNSSRTAWIGIHGNEQIKASVQAKACDNQANAVLIKFLAKQFHLKAKDVEIISGEKNPNKTVLIPIQKNLLCSLLESILP